MKITLINTRKVLFEKFNIKHEIHQDFSKYLKDCNRLIDPVRFPNSILYKKHDRYLFEQDTEFRHFLVEDKMWNDIVFQYKLEYKEVQKLISYVILEHLNLDNYKPHPRYNRYFDRFATAQWQDYGLQKDNVDFLS